MERIPEPASGLSILGLSHASSVLAVTILVLTIYILFDMLRPRIQRRRREASESDVISWDDKPGKDGAS